MCGLEVTRLWSLNGIHINIDMKQTSMSRAEQAGTAAHRAAACGWLSTSSDDLIHSTVATVLSSVAT
jgi:hypothetical protein